VTTPLWRRAKAFSYKEPGESIIGRQMKFEILSVLRKYSAILGFLLLICLTLQIASTSYLSLIHKPSELTEVHQENVFKDSWNQMIFYWDTNLTFGIRNFFRPWILLPSPAFNIYSDVLDKAKSNFDDHYAAGYGEVWGYLATTKVHGPIELAGILMVILAGVLFFLVLLIVGAISVMKLARKNIDLYDKADSRTLAEKIKKWLRVSMKDFFILLLFGIFLVLIAGFIEAYISWHILLPIFTEHLEFSIVYLAFLWVFLTWLFFFKLGGMVKLKKYLRTACIMMRSVLFRDYRIGFLILTTF
jgi:hypothetical protein